MTWKTIQKMVPVNVKVYTCWHCEKEYRQDEVAGLRFPDNDNRMVYVPAAEIEPKEPCICVGCMDRINEIRELYLKDRPTVIQKASSIPTLDDSIDLSETPGQVL